MQSARYFCQILITIEFLDTLSKEAQISNFIKIRRVGAELFQADRHTGGRKDAQREADSRFSQFCERA